MNNLRDPFSLRKPSSPFSILAQPAFQAQFQQQKAHLQQQIQPIQDQIQQISTSVSATAKATVETVESVVTETLEDMSFQIPRNVPSFTSSQRGREDGVWNAAFGKNRDLPLYKDKPYYSKNAAAARRRSPRKRTVLLMMIFAVFGLWWFEFFGNAGEYKEKLLKKKPLSEVVDWSERQEMVKEVFRESWQAYERDAWGSSFPLPSHLFTIDMTPRLRRLPPYL